MSLLGHLSIQSKLILILVAVSLTAVLAVSYSSYVTARNAAVESARRQMLGVRITKTNMLKGMLGNFRDQLTASPPAARRSRV